jgi:hypothetical protein
MSTAAYCNNNHRRVVTEQRCAQAQLCCHNDTASGESRQEPNQAGRSIFNGKNKAYHVRDKIRVSAKHIFVIKSIRTLMSLFFFCDGHVSAPKTASQKAAK